METTESNFWRKCSTCKKPIAYGQKYYVCSVSTCNNPRTGYVFCSMPCFEVHVPGARHRDAGAIAHTAPANAVAAASAGVAGETRAPQRIIPKNQNAPGGTNASTAARASAPQEVLIIASRLKDYIQARGDMNTSASVMDVLSDYVRVVADRAIDNARADGRKTVMDRDFSFLKER